MEVFNFLIILTLAVEVYVLAYLEIKAWGTLYTPLNCLMLPYCAVLLITIAIQYSDYGFVSLFYPSIIFWIFGLFIFSIPSYVLAYGTRGQGEPKWTFTSIEPLPKWLLIFFIILAVLFLLHLKSIIASSQFILGSDEFAEDFTGHGLWAHLRLFTTASLVLCIYYLDKRHWYLVFPIVVFLGVSLLYQVKGWFIIPVIAAIIMRFYTGKSHLTLKKMILVFIGGFVAFFGSYALMIFIGQDQKVSDGILEFIFGHFFHYLTSGILGWSMDVERGLNSDNRDFEIIISQIVNIGNKISGDDTILSPVNDTYFWSGLSWTNVRTHFGSIYINTNIFQFIIYNLFLSTCMYLLLILVKKRSNVFIFSIYFFFCGFLGVGWFEFYFWHLASIEIPIILLLLGFINKIFRKTDAKPHGLTAESKEQFKINKVLTSSKI